MATGWQSAGGRMTAGVEFDPKQFEEVRALFRGFPQKLPVAMRDAVNRTAATVRKRTVDVITGELNIKRRDLDGEHRYGGVKVRKATVESLEAGVSVTGSRIPIFRFGARQNKTGVTYQVSRSGGRGLIRRGFVATMKSGHVGVFQRLGPKTWVTRTKGPRRFEQRIFEPFGPSIPHVAGRNPGFKKLLDVEAGDELQKNLASQIDRFVLKPKASPAAGAGGGER